MLTAPLGWSDHSTSWATAAAYRSPEIDEVPFIGHGYGGDGGLLGRCSHGGVPHLEVERDAVLDNSINNNFNN